MPADFTHFCRKLALAFKLAGAILASRNSYLYWWKPKCFYLLCITCNMLCSDKTWLKVKMKGWRRSPHNTRDSVYTEEQKFCSAAWFCLWQALVSTLLREKWQKGQTYARDLCCIDVGTDAVLWPLEGSTTVSCLSPDSGFPGLLHVLFVLADLSYSQLSYPLAPKSSRALHRSCEQSLPHTIVLPLGVLCLLATLSSTCWEAQHCNISCLLK